MATSAVTDPTSTSAGIYFIVTTTPDGCTDTASVTVTVNPKPVLSITDPADVCEPNTVDIMDAAITTGSTNLGTNTYFTNAAATNIVADPTTVGDGTYFVVTASTDGCTDTAAVTVTVNPLPTFTLAGTNPTSCGGTDGNIEISGLVAGSDYDVAFNSNAATTLTADGSGVITITGLAAGAYPNFIITKLPEGCSSTDSGLALSDPGSPTVDAGTPQTICESESVTLTATNPDGATISWDNGVSNGITFIPTTLDTTTYTVTANLAGCISIDKVNVIVNATPVLSVTDPAAVCEPNTVDITSAAITAGSINEGINTYFTGAAATTAVADPTVVGTGTYFIVSTTTGGCTDTASVTVTVNSLPTFTITGTDPTTCDARDGSISIVGLIANSDYEFTFNGDVATTLTANSTGIIDFTNLAAGDYNNFIITKLPEGCSTTDAGVTLTSPITPTVEAGLDQIVCEGMSVTLTASNPTGASISWDNGVNDGAAFMPNTGTTTYVVTAALNGCIVTDQVNVIVNANPIVTDLSDQLACDNYTLPAITGNNLTGNEAYFTASNGGGTRIAAGTTVTTTTTLFIYDETGTNPNCSSEESVSITIENAPIVSVNPASDLCFGETAAIQLTGTNTGITWIVSNDNVTWDTLSNQQGTTLSIVPSTHFGLSTSGVPVNLYYQAEIIPANSCPTFYTVVNQLVEYSPLVGSIDTTQDCNQNSIDLSADDSDLFTTFTQWLVSTDGTNFTSISNDQSFTESPVENAWYIAEFTNPNNCTLLDTVQTVECPIPLITIPNAVTVNGDDANETFFIDKIWFFPNNVLKIYNRWGSLIYRSEGYHNEWEGTRNGNPMPVGTYYYVLELNDKNNSVFQGSITLLRP